MVHTLSGSIPVYHWWWLCLRCESSNRGEA